MARDAPEEPQPHRRVAVAAARDPRWQPHRVARTQAQHVAIEVQRDHGRPGRIEHHMALLAGDERVAQGTDNATVPQRDAVEHLEGAACRVLEEP